MHSTHSMHSLYSLASMLQQRQHISEGSIQTVLQFPPRASLSKLVSLDCLNGTCPSFLLRAFTVCSKKVRDLLMAFASCMTT